MRDQQRFSVLRDTAEPAAECRTYLVEIDRMEISSRIDRYKAIEDYRKRPLIIYATSTRPGLGAMMAADAVREFIDQVDAITDGDAVDVLIHSAGGDGLTAWKIMSILRERFKKIGVLVPNSAFSAATIFALGADEIVMHPHASLGPIDPQLGQRQPDGSVRGFAYEDIGGFLRFLAEDVHLTEQPHLATLADKLFGSVDPVLVGAAKRASSLSADIGARLLSTHMADDRKAKQIALNLNKAFFAHGDAVSRTRAKELELRVAHADVALEKLIWAAYLGLEQYLQLRTPFNPLLEFYADPACAKTLAPPAALNLPADTPPEAAQQAWNIVLTQAVARANASGAEIERVVINAVVESRRCASQHRSRRRIRAALQASGDIKVWMTDVATGWETIGVEQRIAADASPASLAVGTGTVSVSEVVTASEAPSSQTS